MPQHINWTSGEDLLFVKSLQHKLHLTMNGASAPNGTPFANGGGTGFLSFNSHPPRVYVTAEDDEFDETALQNWRDEGEVPSVVYLANGPRLSRFLHAHGRRGKGVPRKTPGNPQEPK